MELYELYRKLIAEGVSPEEAAHICDDECGVPKDEQVYVKEEEGK